MSHLSLLMPLVLLVPMKMKPSQNLQAPRNPLEVAIGVDEAGAEDLDGGIVAEEAHGVGQVPVQEVLPLLNLHRLVPNL